MRKGKALLLGLVLAVMSISFYADQQIMMMLALAACSLLTFGYSISKYYRDHKIIADSQQEIAKGAQTSQAIPPITSKGSRRLFVPEPLDD